MRASNIILLWTLHNVHNSPFFVSFEIKNQFFSVSLVPFLISRGRNLSVVNYQNPGKSQEKMKPTLCFGHYVTDITLWTPHYEYIYYIMGIMTACMTFIMVILLGGINATCIPILFKFLTSKFAVLLTKHL